jgi:hypothetical protein
MTKLCPLCDGTTQVLQRPDRLIGATYPEDDPWKGDEHFVNCPLCYQSPWDMAKGTGKTIITPVMGPMIGVYYPHRKTGDLYVALGGKPVHCCQCDADFPLEELSAHIESHDTRRRKK